MKSAIAHGGHVTGTHSPGIKATQGRSLQTSPVLHPDPSPAPRHHVPHQLLHRSPGLSPHLLPYPRLQELLQLAGLQRGSAVPARVRLSSLLPVGLQLPIPMLPNNLWPALLLQPRLLHAQPLPGGLLRAQQLQSHRVRACELQSHCVHACELQAPCVRACELQAHCVRARELQARHV